MAGILDTIREQVNSLSADEVRQQLLKIQEQKAKQREHHKTRGAKPMTDEQKEKRKEYNRARIAKPEVKAKMKEYHQRPEVKERMKAYHQKRNAKNKAIMDRARELAASDPAIAELLAKKPAATTTTGEAAAPQA
jgi:hypothetical protein